MSEMKKLHWICKKCGKIVLAVYFDGDKLVSIGLKGQIVEVETARLIRAKCRDKNCGFVNEYINDFIYDTKLAYEEEFNDWYGDWYYNERLTDKVV